MMFDPTALDAANQLIAERLMRAELDAVADAAVRWRAAADRAANELATQKRPIRFERWIPPVELALIVVAVLLFELAAALWGVDSRDLWRIDHR